MRVAKTARGATSSTRDPGGMRFRSPGSATVLCASALSHCASIRMSIPTSKPEQRPLFSFGVIADVQWADADDGSNYDKTVVRRYRGAFRTLGRAVDWWNLLVEPPTFIAQLGDIIDGVNVQLGQSERALELSLAALRQAPCPAVSIIGNHELYNFDRAQLARQSGEGEWLKHGDKEYHSFAPADGWRVVVLDPYQLALIGHAQDDPRRLAAVDLIGRENPSVDPSGAGGEWFKDVSGYNRRFVPYNGGLGEEQLAWLRAELAAAAAAAERVVIMCHVILHPKACGGGTMVWDYPEALEAICSEEAAGCVAAVLCGHDHFGGYHRDEHGVHHCTFCSPLNRGDEGAAFGLINVREESLEVVGPCVDDLLPTLKRGEPTGRPESVPCAGGAEAQAVTLELPPRRSVSVNSKSERLARARL